jgi:pimeloyl-ACP methyl ester carboxylesterase
MDSFPPRFGKNAATAAAGAAAVVVLACLLLASPCLIACGSSATTTSTAMTTASTAGASAEPSTSHQVTSKPVSFPTDDGVTLSGHLFGSGQAGVILAHMYPADQTSWFPTAERLAAEGYLVLALDFRGYGESGGSKEFDRIDRDVIAAVNEMRKQGASSLVLVGASMGGTACLVAGEQAQALSSIRLAGIATLSAPVEFRGLSAAESVPRIIVPLLFIAAEKDEGADGARELEKLSSGKGELQILPGQDHGTDLLTGAQSDATCQLLLDFIRSAVTL